VVNFAVDGLNGGAIENNTMRFSQGDRVLNCDVAADYTVGHVFDVARLQPGYVVRTYDAGLGCGNR